MNEKIKQNSREIVGINIKHTTPFRSLILGFL
jgi:hypothetical protein